MCAKMVEVSLMAWFLAASMHPEKTYDATETPKQMTLI